MCKEGIEWESHMTGINETFIFLVGLESPAPFRLRIQKYLDRESRGPINSCSYVAKKKKKKRPRFDTNINLTSIFNHR